jgi:hypothetical protein
MSEFKLRIREDRPATIQERRELLIEIERLHHDIDRHVGITTEQQAEIERLRTALTEIVALDNVRRDEVRSIARRALIAAE